MNFSSLNRSESCFLLSLLFLIVLQSCIYRIDKINVEADFKGNPRTFFYVSRFDGNSLNLIDSFKTNSRGHLKFTLNTENPYFVTIGLNKVNTPIILLIQPGDDINIQSEDSNLSDYKVFGSNGSVLLKDLSLRLNRTKLQIDSLKKVYNNSLGNLKIDSISALVDSSYQSILKEYKDYSYSFVRENTFSLVSILALFQSYDSLHPVFDYEKDRKLYQLVDSSLHSVYSSNRMVKAYHEKIQKLDAYFKRIQKRKAMFKVDEVLPNAGYPLLNGENLFISGIWFKYILIDFWGPWCEKCSNNNIQLKRIYKEYAPKGLVVLQVSLGMNPDSLSKIVARDTILWYNASIPDMYNSKLLDTLKISSIPSSYITDRWGRIKAVNLTGEKLESKLKELLPK